MDEEYGDILGWMVENKFTVARGYGITEFTVIEMMKMATNSLWYTQLRMWVEKEEWKQIEALHTSLKAMKAIIDAGKTEHGWWSIWAVAKDEKEYDFIKLGLWTCGGIMEKMRRDTLMVISAWFPHIIALITRTPRWERKATQRARNFALSMIPDKQAIRKCINPECDIEVDIRKRKSGACCRAHQSYECTKPSCVKKAQTKGWKRYMHRHGTAIAASHIGWKK